MAGSCAEGTLVQDMAGVGVSLAATDSPHVGSSSAIIVDALGHKLHGSQPQCVLHNEIVMAISPGRGAAWWGSCAETVEFARKTILVRRSGVATVSIKNSNLRQMISSGEFLIAVINLPLLLEFPEALRGKNVLLATESFGPVNGVSRTTLNLVQYLRRQGVNVAVVAPEISTGSDTNPPPNGNEIEVRLKGYPLPYNPELSVVYPVRLSTLYRRTFNGPPDLIYLASPASLGFQVLLQLRQQQEQDIVPVLLNFQTDLSGYCEILFPSPLDNWAVWVFRGVQGYLFRHPSVRTVFYPSLFVRKYLEKAKVQPDKMRNLRRGVDGVTFHPSKRSEEMRKDLAPNGELILVSVARLAPEKGFEFLSQVVKKLDERGFPFKLLIVGGNRNPQVEQDVRDLFGHLNDEGKVVYTGFLKGESLAKAYACGDIFLHCSITETFGLVVLESMASGVPVIARDEGGPSEIVADGKSGYLVPPTDLDGFVQRVLEMGSNSQLREKMSIESRRMAEEATWDSIGNQVAWKMVEALENREAPLQKTPNFTIPIYSWLLLSPELRTYLTSLVVDARLMGGIGIIFGAWCGLAITWVLVQASLLVRARAPWHHRFLRCEMQDDTQDNISETRLFIIGEEKLAWPQNDGTMMGAVDCNSRLRPVVAMRCELSTDNSNFRRARSPLHLNDNIDRKLVLTASVKVMDFGSVKGNRSRRVAPSFGAEEAQSNERPYPRPRLFNDVAEREGRRHIAMRHLLGYLASLVIRPQALAGPC
ncbi:hypothetical protein G7Y89_g9879 [Cudoniella acicularis]|uniref:Glycosyl transferase family 1 domain-containing protein n=1 Tax=Cudoniella acicularis TaxID=354080 RepID=A0A8H4W256_9HELO|nr:hypothetical protein G7Y89_g9879 [Cudoniella acicularis]